MFKTFRIFIVIILLTLCFNGCSSSEIEELKKTNFELQEELNMLDLYNKHLNKLLSVKENMIVELGKKSNENSGEDKYLLDSFTINIGQKELGLEILNIKIERTPLSINYFADFKGEILLNGVLIMNMVGGSLYTFMVDEDYIMQIPMLVDTNKMFINISNDEEITRLY